MPALAEPRTDWRKLHRIADRYVPRFARTFEASAKQLRERVTSDLIAEDLARGLTGEPRSLYELIDGLAVAKAPDPAQSVYAELLAGAGSLQANMTVQSPFVQEAARTLTANLVTNVRAESKRAVRTLIFEAIRDGDPPDVVQRQIRQVVGLTRRDALAVRRLTQLGSAEARVERYSRQMLRRRALNIARTETIRASNRGQQLAWREMVSDNLIDTSRFMQRWLVTDDDRLCELCAPMDGMTVALGGGFESSQKGVLESERVAYAGESVESPPLHPSCRCVLTASFD